MTDIRKKPVWQLTSEELDLLAPQERQWAISHVGYLRETGALAIILANPPGTTYEIVWDGSLGGWKPKPIFPYAPVPVAWRFRHVDYVDWAFSKDQPKRESLEVEPLYRGLI